MVCKQLGLQQHLVDRHQTLALAPTWSVHPVLYVAYFVFGDAFCSSLLPKLLLVPGILEVANQHIFQHVGIVAVLHVF